MEDVILKVEFHKWKDDLEKWNSRIYRKWVEVLNRKNFGATAPKRGAVGEIFYIFNFFLCFFVLRPEAAENFGEEVGIFGILVGKMSKIVTFSGILANPLVSTHPRPNPNPFNINIWSP